jgi:hypothetical protein
LAERDVARKLRVYQTMHRLNLSFTNIVVQCRMLGDLGVLRRKFAKLYQSYAQELQAEINSEVTGILESTESDDMFRFGKARTAREKELRDPDDVFIEAEERRKEIARQRGKARRSQRKVAKHQRQ